MLRHIICHLIFYRVINDPIAVIRILNYLTAIENRLDH